MVRAAWLYFDWAQLMPHEETATFPVEKTHGQYQHSIILRRWLRRAAAKICLFWWTAYAKLDSELQQSTVRSEIESFQDRPKPQVLALASCTLRIATRAMALHAAVRKKHFHD